MVSDPLTALNPLGYNINPNAALPLGKQLHHLTFQALVEVAMGKIQERRSVERTVPVGSDHKSAKLTFIFFNEAYESFDGSNILLKK